MSIKNKLQAGKIVIGPFVIIPSVSMIDTLGYSGMDFCIIDTEHGPISFESANDLVVAARATGVSSIVRVGSKEEWPILRALDIGSDGIDNDADGLVDTEDSDEYGSSREAALRIVADNITNRIIEELISNW